MRIGFDIGGVLSKYPHQFDELMRAIYFNIYFHDIFIVTDQHPKEEVLKTLAKNGFDWLNPDNVYCADYEKYGNAAKCILIAQLGIQVFIDDFEPYLQWDSTFGEQPILLRVQPDMFKPYWHSQWKCEGGDFGRRHFTTTVETVHSNEKT